MFHYNVFIFSMLLVIRKTITLIFPFSFLVLCLSVQHLHSSPFATLPPKAYYWISFTDKEHTPYRISEPGEYLSERALTRRQKQSIAINESDLPVDPQYIKAVISHDSISYVYASRWFNGVLIRFSAHEDVLNEIRSYPFVSNVRLVKPDISKMQHAKPDKNTEVITKPVGGTMSNRSDVYSFESEYLESHITYKNGFSIQVSDEYGESSQHLNQLGASFLHDHGYLGDGIHIGILDAGFLDVDLLHDFSSLHTEGRILGTNDFVNPGSDVYRAHPHGMYVLSTMAAKSPGRLWGAAAEASYWLLRTEDAASEYIIEEYNWVAGIEFADSAGVDIVNSSLGYTRFDESTMNYQYSQFDGKTTITARAAAMAVEKGMLVVNSAGNYGNGTWQYIGTPADADHILAVGAVDESGIKTSFSSVGPTFDQRIKPDVMARGYRVPVTGLKNDIVYVSGTSYASPLIAGLSACLWQKYQSLPVKDIRQAIIKSSDRYLIPDTMYGHGIPNFELAAASLEVILENDSISIFPNPIIANSSISLYTSFDDMVRIELVNSIGQIVYKIDNLQIHKGYNSLFPFSRIAHLNNGVYFFRLTGNDKMHVRKVFIMN